MDSISVGLTRADMDSAQRRHRIRQWIAAAVAVTVLTAGFTVAVEQHAPKPAHATSNSSYCPSGDVNYYRARHWTVCGYLVSDQWHAAVYMCAVYRQQISGLTILTDLGNANVERICQDEYLTARGNMDDNSRLYYYVDLYQLSVIARNASFMIHEMYTTFLGLLAISHAVTKASLTLVTVEPCANAGPATIKALGLSGSLANYAGWGGGVACSKAFYALALKAAGG